MIANPDLFMHLFVHGIPQIDVWSPNRSRIPKPEQPQRPSHPRPARPLPRAPSETSLLWASLTDDEHDLLDFVSSEPVMCAANVAESFHMSDGDCPTGWRVALEYACDCAHDGEPIEDPDGIWTFDMPTALSLLRKMHAAEKAERTAYAANVEECRAIRAAPDADPAWRAYDEAMAAYPARLAEWRERVKADAQRRSGFASREEAVADYFRRNPYTSAHFLTGYAPDARVGGGR